MNTAAPVSVIEYRFAKIADLETINAIYNEAVANTTATFDTSPKSAAERQRWFEMCKFQYPIVVAVEDEKVVGYGSLNPFDLKPGYKLTAEISIYIDKAYRGRGIGKAVLAQLIKHGKAYKPNLHTLVARVETSNVNSLQLFLRHDFTTSGVLKEVGNKFGKWLDVAYLQYLYQESN